jgi:hypothetical protein
MKGVKKCCISDEIDRWKDEEEGSTIGSEAEEDCRNGDWSETGEAE